MSQPTWEQAIKHGPAGRLPEPYQTHWDSISAGISHVYFASDDDYDEALGREMTEEEFNKFSEWDWQRQKRVIAVAFFEMLRLVKNDLLRMSTLAELIRNAQAAEREACARVCEQLGMATNGMYERNHECATAIRARGQA